MQIESRPAKSVHIVDGSGIELASPIPDPLPDPDQT
jgi:hypothetical protein